MQLDRQRKTELGECLQVRPPTSGDAARSGLYGMPTIRLPKGMRCGEGCIDMPHSDMQHGGNRHVSHKAGRNTWRTE